VSSVMEVIKQMTSHGQT